MICLSFDIEEFDTPREYGSPIHDERQLEISTRGAERILEMLQGLGIRATFFCTANFAEHRPHIVHRIVNEGHELASHSYYHSKFTPTDYVASREVLERISGVKVVGYRSPRMGAVDYAALTAAGYEYDSSLNPTYLPGRYNNRKEPRSIFRKGSITEIPSSVSSYFRIPLFWLSLHNFPLSLYIALADRAVKRDGYLNVYFHPWEFTADCSFGTYRLPFYIKRNSGEALVYRLSSVIVHFKERGDRFGTLSELSSTVKMAEK